MKLNRGITLIALVITIVILLILAGITIAALGGENGLLARVTQAKQTQIESEMKEQLTLAVQELQVEKTGNATLDDITQEWIDEKIKDYDCTVKEDATINGKRIIMEKNGIICKFLIDEDLNITVIEESESGAQLEYEAISRDGENVKILITITDKEYGLEQIEFPDGTIIYCNGEEKISKDYEVQLGVEYKVKITSKDGQIKEKLILINDFYYNITTDLDKGASIDNKNTKISYTKSYEGTISLEENYVIDQMEITMGEQTLAVDSTTGKIEIKEITGDINIKVITKKLEIIATKAYIGKSTGDINPENSVEDNSQKRGTTTLYINFSATLEGTACTITNKDDGKSLPYAVTSNGIYTFVAEGMYKGKAITKEIQVKVNKYPVAFDIVQYNAGIWTQEEINELSDLKLYKYNPRLEYGDGTYYLNNSTGYNFTFGGYTAGSSRNNSINGAYYGAPLYDGWQIMNKETKQDDNGNIKKNKDGTDRLYVTKLVHAGASECFVLYHNKDNLDGYRCEYLLSSGERRTTYNMLNDGKTLINPRNWDKYKDEDLDSKGYIKNVHVMTYDEAFDITGDKNSTQSIRNNGAGYVLANTWWSDSGSIWGGSTWVVNTDGSMSNDNTSQTIGVRLVVEMENGVYIASGDGTVDSPYVLGKE